mmetsp:Transcript_26487/g.66655  ORF Transcript_26487/g.66655 Transcript_26487/m.66655 type:complete len:254 (+) Transcript_26487:676-1437(+)
MVTVDQFGQPPATESTMNIDFVIPSTTLDGLLQRDLVVSTSILAQDLTDGIKVHRTLDRYTNGRARTQIDAHPLPWIERTLVVVGDDEHVLGVTHTGGGGQLVRCGAHLDAEMRDHQAEEVIQLAPHAQRGHRVEASALQVHDYGALAAALQRLASGRLGAPIGVHARERSAQTQAEVGTLLDLEHPPEEVVAQRSAELHHRVGDVVPGAVDLVDARLRKAGALRKPIVVLLHVRVQEAVAVQRGEHVVRVGG